MCPIKETQVEGVQNILRRLPNYSRRENSPIGSVIPRVFVPFAPRMPLSPQDLIGEFSASLGTIEPITLPVAPA